jgi:hypothetical protein
VRAGRIQPDQFTNWNISDRDWSADPVEFKQQNKKTFYDFILRFSNTPHRFRTIGGGAPYDWQSDTFWDVPNLWLLHRRR